ncbi:NUDIX hydrolase [Halobacterium litoreum]|uniref:NUDIX hydrolase n=1 Tax=Halobacterium litoreum TaxID=2039234 RepID=A0ABD5NBC0_9EURY|nr:NUDIX hydrolase [Halobacterium litoreum]UHH14726.1 NUDIX hydrolase [Halobacterium litoreum]
MGENWQTLSQDTKFECPWFSVGSDQVRNPDGEVKDYYWVDRPKDAIAVVAVSDGKVVMVEQYRPKLKQKFTECPGGHVEEEESHIEAAKRELREETGISASEFFHLSTYYPTATARYKRSIIVAEGLSEGQSTPEDSEYIDWRYVSVDRALDIAASQPATGWTLAPLTLARERGYI